jgi:hypothetical protein
MNLNRKNIGIIERFHSISLIVVSIIFLFLFLASGHGLNFEDSTQLKSLFETIVFFLSGISLFPSLQKESSGYGLVLILLILVQVSLVDLFFEFFKEERNSSIPILLFFNLLISMINLFLIYSFFKKGQVNKS